MGKNYKVRYVGLNPGVNKIVRELAANETEGRVGPMIRVLVIQALKIREAIESG